MKINFITSNLDKFDQAKFIAKKFGHDIIHLNFSLDEIQSLDPMEVVNNKLNQAMKFASTMNFIVEDTSLYLDCFDNKFPGPLAKHMYQALGQNGIVDLVYKYNNTKATAQTVIASHINNIFNFHTGSVDGILRKSSSYLAHGFDDIFVPNNYDIPFSKMSFEENTERNMRGMAFSNLFNYLSFQ